jgi:hypothetical protein
VAVNVVDNTTINGQNYTSSRDATPNCVALVVPMGSTVSALFLRRGYAAAPCESSKVVAARTRRVDGLRALRRLPT